MPCYLLSSEGDILETTDGDQLISYIGFDYPLTATVSDNTLTSTISQADWTAVIDQ
jgi:hypothetical protein